MTTKERQKLDRQRQTQEWMLACFGGFVLLQLLAMYVALDERGYSSVVCWMLLSFIPLVLSIRAWLRLGRERSGL